MISRIRFLITAAVTCHLLLAPTLVTSQLQSGSATSPSRVEEAQVSAITQEMDGRVFKLHGAATVQYRSYTLYADEMTYNADTGDATAEGHVVLDGGPYDEHVRATRGTYNVRTETGRFYDVNGTAGFKVRGSRYVLTTSSPFVFSGKVVEKTGNRYVVSHGTITTCELPHPKWEFRATKLIVEAGADAKVYNSSFLVRGIPVFYFPFATHPVEKQERQSGFLIPSIGNSSRKGYIVGESFYWAINRSADATIGAEYYSLRGWSQRGEFRMRPSETSFIDLNYFGVIDRGIGYPPVDQGGEEARLNAEGRFGHHFRGVANIDYLSSFVFRQAFNEVFTQAVNSEVKSQAFLSNTTRGFSFNALAQRYQNFQSTEPGDVVTILHIPSFSTSSVDRKIGRTPLYWSFDAAGEGLSRSEPGFRTANLLGRFDLSPNISLPLLFRGWSFRPELGLRETMYTQQLLPSTDPDAVGTAIDNVLNRKALLASVELRPPSLSRIFEGEHFGRKWKHVIEPRFVYSYATGVNNFDRVIQFDERDILTNTNEVEYAIVNRLFAKRRDVSAEDCSSEAISSLTVGGASSQSMIPWERTTGPQEVPCYPATQVRAVVSWELAQKYFIDPTFGGAIADGRRNVFTTTADFTGIAFLTQPRHLSPLISRLRVETSARTNAEWDADYDFRTGRLNASTALINYHFRQFTFGGGDAFLHLNGNASSTTPAQAEDFHQFRVLFGYGVPNKRGFSGAASIGFDEIQGFLQYATGQANYNWDCCGVSLEYRRFALGSVRNENQFRFAFTLANVGAFGNLRRQERLF